MDSLPKLAGETLIVHHIPLVHCQVPDRQYCPSSSRPHLYSKNDLGITRTTSLPERDLSQADSLVYSSLIQASEPTVKDKVSTKEEDWQGSITRKRHNPFLLNDEEENSTSSGSDGEKSFHLHSTLGRPKSGFQFQDLSLPPFHLHDKPPIVKPWIVASRSGLVDGQEEKTSPDDLQVSSNGNPGPSNAIIEDQAWHHHGGPHFCLDWNQSSDLGNQDLLQSKECTCNGSEPLRHCRCYSASSQSEMDQQVSYVSDSSCNSSDGILVNFSTLYNKMNGHPRSNLNSGSLSCDSSFCSHPDTGAFYLDLQTSPTESKMSCDSHIQEASGKPCGCHHHSSSPVLDANCNSYHLNYDSVPCNGESSDLTSCFQSQARLVVATQNYYKLVTCDLSSQSSPSPAGSSITSCSDDHTKGSPVQPTEYFLFQQPQTSSDTDDPKPLIERSKSDTIEGQVYVNVSPPNFNTGRQRSRSYDRSLDKTPSNRLGSLERMMSCPVKLSEGQAAHTQESSPKRVTSFKELAKSRKKNGSSPPFRSSGDSSLEEEYHHDSSRTSDRGEFRSHSLPPMSFLHCMSRTCEGCTSDSVETKAPNPNPAPSSSQAYGTTGLAVDQPLMCNLLDSGASGLSFLQRDARVKGDGKPSAVSSSDFFPDYFSLTERPPAEFCLSPDGSAESVSIDLLQKRGLVKAVNIAVDLIVAHFGTSRDPGVKAKLGNSSVSPNIGHLILKYLCPAIRDILGDGLKPWVLDVIIGQRRNMPWTVVEASTQLGPSTKLLHFLCQKVNQYSELSNHSLRFNAFIFGLLNIRSVEFWFNHLYNHEDIIWAHYDLVGFLSVSHGVCQPLFEELLLLLQPLSLLPFDLDLLFEHHLVQMSREQQQQKEMLRVKQDLMQSFHSTIQLMRSREEEDQEKKSCEKSSLEVSDMERPTGEGAAAVEIEEEQKKEHTVEVKRDKQAGWWYQLMQSSQVYIENSSDRAKFMRQDRRRPGNGGTPKKAPPPREGVVDGAEACPGLEGMVEEKSSKKETADDAQKERKSWMGSPPESVLNELKRGQEKEKGDTQNAAQHGVHESAGRESTQSSPARKWGHLFGSRKPLGEGKQNNRLPSGWLSLDKSVFQMVAQTVSTGIWGDAAAEKEATVTEGAAPPASPCAQNPRPLEPFHHHAEQKQQDFRFVYEPQSDQLRCGLVRRNGLMPLKFVPQPDRVDS
ncbi:AP-4 complex accessory subunit RUSC2 isoform X3 [Pseudophryne corroboree]|uniref:AP-4 complex accessory subunit RUSC2 isoform X3 n=1 Tax=Pseudophryne corroboree TaxID=495146 RepID=UPI0030813E67